LTPTRLAVFSVPNAVVGLLFTNKGVEEPVEVYDPSKARTSPSSCTLLAEIPSFADTGKARFLVKAQPSD
jgi:hypothetical protein